MVNCKIGGGHWDGNTKIRDCGDGGNVVVVAWIAFRQELCNHISTIVDKSDYKSESDNQSQRTSFSWHGTNYDRKPMEIHSKINNQYRSITQL